MNKFDQEQNGGELNASSLEPRGESNEEGYQQWTREIPKRVGVPEQDANPHDEGE